MAKINALSRDALLYLFHHVFLAPRLPSQLDSKSDLDYMLCEIVSEALGKFEDLMPGEERLAVQEMKQMVESTCHLHAASTTHVDQAKLEQSLRSLTTSGNLPPDSLHPLVVGDRTDSVSSTGGTLVMQIAAQNAGLIISAADNLAHGSLLIECFELSPLNEAVVGTAGRLRRSFPGGATLVGHEVTRDPAFAASVAETLALMSHQSVAGQQPKVQKAKQLHDETRDTTHPGIVSELFYGIVTALGKPADVTPLEKNCRDEVMFLDAHLPWRRSPMWLLLRVSLQLGFTRLQDRRNIATDLYKLFMVFFMASILQQCKDCGLASAVLFAMNAKITRRLLKLDKALTSAVVTPIRRTMYDAESVMMSRWIAVQNQQCSNLRLEELSSLRFDQDFDMDLPDLDDFVRSIDRRTSGAVRTAFSPVVGLATHDSRSLPDLDFDEAAKSNLVQNLHSFENWVAEGLSDWVSRHLSNQNASSQLEILIQKYHHFAAPLYSANPEANSVMLLVLMELWIASDRIAISICPLLGNFMPGIHRQPLQNLLLAYREQAIRLDAVETYLDSRAEGIYPEADLFGDGRPASRFATSYFDQSPQHQNLYQKIVNMANQHREQKVSELRTLQTRYSELQARYEQSACEFCEVLIDPESDTYETRHVAACKHCHYKSQMNNLQIDVHEWPLPRDPNSAKTVVFELQVPPWFGHWRDSTTYLRLNVCKATYTISDHFQSERHLSADPHLSHFFHRFSSLSSQRIGLLSDVKANIGTHRKGKSIATSVESDVCIANGLIYRYVDTKERVFTSEALFGHKTAQACTYQLPRRSQAVQSSLFRPAEQPSGPPPNAIIARQSECPDHLTLHEYKELAGVPLGYHLQWWNIAVQLGSPSVDFKKPETRLVFLQCMYQAGPPPKEVGSVRPSHALLCDVKFASMLLTNLEYALKRIIKNWELLDALSLFAAIAARVLSISASTDIHQRCLMFLQAARRLSLEWTVLLTKKAYDASSTEKDFLDSRSTEAALVCASTFDVDRSVLLDILRDDESASTLLQCTIVIYDGRQSIDRLANPLAGYLHVRHQRVLCDAYPTLAQATVSLDNAITKSWTGFRPSSAWTASAESPHWMTTTTNPDVGPGNIVHLNLLSGELLVNGLPLNRLPSAYEQHACYKTLFGKATIAVMPSDVVGMEFSSKQNHQGFHVSFGLNPSKTASKVDLLVRIHRLAPKTGDFELLPSRLLVKQVPTSFSRDYVHWYNRFTGNVEFREAANPWQLDELPRWVLIRSRDSSWRLSQPNTGKVLVNVKSPTAQQIARVLSPLTQPLCIHIVSDQAAADITVSIPHLRLNLGLSQGKSELYSQEFAGADVDSDQSLGALLGFQSRLLLRDRITGERTVLILEGQVEHVTQSEDSSPSPWRGGHHVRVRVQQSTATRVLPFHIDCQLGRLVDNGDLQSKLFLAYLHALTSHCLCDPLTRLTGAEQALTILRSASVRSFSRLTQANVDTLVNIADITPSRTLYPEHERVMQSVKWAANLDFLSQRSEYYLIVQSIFADSQRLVFLYPTTEVHLPQMKRVDSHLLLRAQIRSSWLNVSEFGAEAFTTVHDKTYEGRDRDRHSAKYQRSYMISGRIQLRQRGLFHASPSRDDLWQFLCNSEVVFGMDLGFDSSKLKYDGKLLGDSASFLAEMWMIVSQHLINRNYSLNKYSFMTWLSALASSERVPFAVAEMFACFYTDPGRFRAFRDGHQRSFNVSMGYQVTQRGIMNDTRPSLRPRSWCPEALWSRRPDERSDNFNRRKQSHFLSTQQSSQKQLASALQAQWPTSSPSTPDIPNTVYNYIDVARAMALIQPAFAECKHNLDLFTYLGQVTEDLNIMGTASLTIPEQALSRQNIPARTKGFIPGASLFAGPAPTLDISVTPSDCIATFDIRQRNVTHVQSLVKTLRQSTTRSLFAQSYVRDLHASVKSLQQTTVQVPKTRPSLECLKLHLRDCQSQLDCMNATLYSIQPAHLSSEIAPIARQTHAWPRIRPALFLMQLHRDQWLTLPQDWRECIIRYGLAHNTFQRASRLVKAAVKTEDDDLFKELKTLGHETWSPLQMPEWLLLEVESGITIRAVQADIANHMINPPQGRNSSMQLNMGEGKSAIIIPISVASLTDCSKLVRVIIGKAHSKQMAQMLANKLGGLLNRRIYYFPFSRSLELNEASAGAIHSICNECRASGGLLLMQPEHILSFQLMGLQSYISGSERMGSLLLDTQYLFHQNARDLIDESDENFSVKYELVYTMGLQQPIEMSPGRWNLAQQILDLAQEVAVGLQRERPRSVELLEPQAHGFPRIRILDQETEIALAHRMATVMCKVGVPGLSIARQPERIRHAVWIYITTLGLASREADDVARIVFAKFPSSDNKKILLLLRGLLAGGVIGFVLGHKRWRVNYGLDITRSPMTRLAVPFRAKDTPTARSEFSHPDVAILLTCLSYYYSGLDDSLIHTAFEHLQDTDQKVQEYQEWVKGVADLDPSLRQIDGVNLKDTAQCSAHVFPYIRYSKALIDYFLAHFVFPKEMKEFPSKLSASGWDLGSVKRHPTSAFSGTIDSKTLLPLDVFYESLPEQEHTNALVLDYLLQPTNKVSRYQASGAGTVTQDLLAHVMGLRPQVRVILDVGAQVLEMSNVDMARTWLLMHQPDESKAAVFVSDDDVLSVVDRNHFVEPLQTSPFATQLESCIVFLDEAHTRGIDLKLPRVYRAAITLGARLTKDRLVQACMRMRKLGHGQSVVFCVSQEIHLKVTQCTNKPNGAEITTSDVLQWAIQETCTDVQRSLPLWANQGRRFVSQESLWSEFLSRGPATFSQDLARKYLEREAQSLEDRYSPATVTRPSSAQTRGISSRMMVIEDRCHKFGSNKVLDSTLQEEQERELSPEVEQERQAEKIMLAAPAEHDLHRDVWDFVQHGTLLPGSSAYMDAFQVFSGIDAASGYDVAQLKGSGGLLVTADFARTIQQTANTNGSKSFQRSVQWVLVGNEAKEHAISQAMIISPFEAQLIAGRLGSNETAVTLHYYKPHWNMEHVPLDDLEGFSLPSSTRPRRMTSSLAAQMNLFAGRLYFRSTADYRDFCTFLALLPEQSQSDCATTSDGFILDEGKRRGCWPGLKSNPLPFVNAILRIRRDGEDFRKTHMGRLVLGDLRLLHDVAADTAWHSQ